MKRARGSVLSPSATSKYRSHKSKPTEAYFKNKLRWETIAHDIETQMENTDIWDNLTEFSHFSTRSTFVFGIIISSPKTRPSPTWSSRHDATDFLISLLSWDLWNSENLLTVCPPLFIHLMWHGVVRCGMAGCDVARCHAQYHTISRDASPHNWLPQCLPQWHGRQLLASLDIDDAVIQLCGDDGCQHAYCDNRYKHECMQCLVRDQVVTGVR